MEVVASKASSSSKAPSSATRSRADMFAMFGLQEGNQQHPTKRHEDSSVVEVDDSPVKKARGNPVTVQTQFLDSAKLCMVRVLSSGEVVSSVMKAGPNGFAEAFFPGEVVGIPSELPNLLLQLPIKEAPSRQAVKKRPAGKPQKNLRPRSIMTMTLLLLRLRSLRRKKFHLTRKRQLLHLFVGQLPPKSCQCHINAQMGHRHLGRSMDLRSKS